MISLSIRPGRLVVGVVLTLVGVAMACAPAPFHVAWPIALIGGGFMATAWDV